MRDHFRYTNEIMCAGARVVQAVREKARLHSPLNTKGLFDSFHIRRGDFQFKKLISSDINILWEQSKDQLEDGSTLFIATDERDKDFFEMLKSYHNITFLDDYVHLLKDLNPNFFGMVDQLVASQGHVFFGTCKW